VIGRVLVYSLLVNAVCAEQMVLKPEKVYSVNHEGEILKNSKYFYVGCNTPKKKDKALWRTFVDFDIAAAIKDKQVEKATLSVDFLAKKSMPYGSAYLYNIMEAYDKEKVKFEHNSERIGMTLLRDVPSGVKEFDLTLFLKEFAEHKKTHFGFYIRGEEGGAKTLKCFNLKGDDKTSYPYLTIDYTAKKKVKKGSKHKSHVTVKCDGQEFSWTVKHERNIRKFSVYNIDTNKLLIESPAIDADMYSIEIEKGVKAKLVVEKKDGTTEEYKPE